MARVESWREVALALGSRMAYQANACPVGTFQPGSGQDPGQFVGGEGEFHVPDEHVTDCPFCADTVAYRRFIARLKNEPYQPAKKGESR